MSRRRIVTSGEQDVYTGWRRLYCWTQRAGAVKSVKRQTHKRERREGRAEANAQYKEIP